MKWFRCAFFWSLFVVIFLTGCAGDSAPTSEPDPTPKVDDPTDNPATVVIDHDAFGGAMSIAELDAAFQEVTDIIYGSVPPADAPLSDAERADQIVSLVQDLPSVFSAERTEFNDVVIQFADGTPYIHIVGSLLREGSASVAIQSIPGAAADAAADSTYPAVALRQPALLAASNQDPKIPGGGTDPGGSFPEREAVTLPTGNKAVLVNHEHHGDSVEAQIKSMLEDRGYQVKLSSGTLEALESDIKNIDVLWMTTHGTWGKIKTSPNGPESYIYVLTTNSTRPKVCEDDTNCLKRRTQVAADQIMATGSDPENLTHWGITYLFVLEHWHFNTSSFFFLGACQGIIPGDESAMFHWGLKMSNLGALMGWDNIVWLGGTNESAKFVFDLVLGANKHTGILPKQRPFSIDAVYDYLVATGQTKERSLHPEPAYLKYLRFTDKRVALVPSLITMTPEENDQTGYLYGEFGDLPADQVQVLLNDNPLTIAYSDNGKIVAYLPTTDLSGNLQVVTGKRKSNKLPLTLWQGDFSQTNEFKSCGSLFGTPGITAEVLCSPMRFRADIHGFRLKPGGPIIGRAVGAGSDQRVPIVDQVKDTDCHLQVTGSSVLPLQTKLELTGPTTSLVPWMHHKETRDKPWNFVLGNIDIDTRKLILQFNYYAPFDMKLYTWDLYDDSWIYVGDMPFSATSNVPGMNSHPIQLDAQYKLSENNVSVPIPSGGLADCKFTFTGDLPAYAAPDENTEH